MNHPQLDTALRDIDPHAHQAWVGIGECTRAVLDHASPVWQLTKLDEKLSFLCVCEKSYALDEILVYHLNYYAGQDPAVLASLGATLVDFASHVVGIDQANTQRAIVQRESVRLLGEDLTWLLTATKFSDADIRWLSTAAWRLRIAVECLVNAESM